MASSAESDGRLVEQLMAEIAELEERVAALEADRERVADLEQQVAELDTRTDLLRLIDEADGLDGRQRSTALIQHCIREIQQSPRLEQVTINRDGAEQALHHPDVDRTTIYSDMERCERLVGDTSRCRYEAASDGTTDEAALTIDLRGTDAAVEASTLINGGA